MRTSSFPLAGRLGDRDAGVRRPQIDADDLSHPSPRAVSSPLPGSSRPAVVLPWPWPRRPSPRAQPLALYVAGLHLGQDGARRVVGRLHLLDGLVDAGVEGAARPSATRAIPSRPSDSTNWRCTIASPSATAFTSLRRLRALDGALEVVEDGKHGPQQVLAARRVARPRAPGACACGSCRSRRPCASTRPSSARPRPAPRRAGRPLSAPTTEGIFRRIRGLPRGPRLLRPRRSRRGSRGSSEAVGVALHRRQYKASRREE